MQKYGGIHVFQIAQRGQKNEGFLKSRVHSIVDSIWKHSFDHLPTPLPIVRFKLDSKCKMCNIWIIKSS